MHDESFERLSKSIAAATTRRGMLFAAAGGLLGVFAPGRVHAQSANCGAVGQSCCANDSCGNGLACQSGRCETCGGANQPCCGDLCAPNTSCFGGQCLCGAADQPCCDGRTCNADGLICAQGQCSRCGAAGQPCCTGDFCENNLLRCANGTCNCPPDTDWLCNEECVPFFQPCNGNCPNDYWLCNGQCIAATITCNGSCPSDRTLMAGACFKTCQAFSDCSSGCDACDANSNLCVADLNVQCESGGGCPPGSFCWSRIDCAKAC